MQSWLSVQGNRGAGHEQMITYLAANKAYQKKRGKSRKKLNNADIDFNQIGPAVENKI
jgi:hypothetical protein